LGVSDASADLGVRYIPALSVDRVRGLARQFFKSPALWILFIRHFRAFGFFGFRFAFGNFPVAKVRRTAVSKSRGAREIFSCFWVAGFCFGIP
jgi:hypothetical protein